MPYEVTAARKRPQNFGQLAGQEFVSATLSASIATGRIAHAYLFSGPRGCGKTSTARILAKALNCETGPTSTPCGVCDSCRSITAGSALDVIEIDGASNTSVDNIRQIKDEVLFPPNSGRYKIYIIDEVHMLSTSAFNALLKTIEEPPPYIVFIFATTELHKVPATIKSRCQQFSFRLVSIETVKALLASVAAELGIEAEDEALLWIAKESGGSLRDAYTLFDQVLSFSSGIIKASVIREKLGLVGLDRLNSLFGCCLRGATKEALEALDGILAQGVSAEQFTIDVVEYCRSLLLVVNGIERESLLGAPASSYDAAVVAGFSSERIERALALFLELYRTLRYTVEQRFELELAVARLCRLADFVSPSDLSKTVAGLRRYLAGEHQAASSRQGQREAPRSQDEEPGQRPVLRAEEPPMPRSERPQAVRPQASQGAVAGAAPTPSTSVPQEQKLQISGESGQQMHSGACETFDSGIDPERLRAELIAEAGRSSPMLRNGLELSGAWCLRDSILQIPFADSGFAMSFAKESIPFLSGIASRICGRQIRVEFPVPGKAPAASGSPASAAAGKNQAATGSVAGPPSRPPPQAGHSRASGDAAVQSRSSSSPAGTVQAAGQASVRVQPPVPGVPAPDVSPPGVVIAQPESPGAGLVPPGPANDPLFRDDTAEPESYGADPEGVGQPDAGTGIYVVASTNPAEASPPADFVAAFHDTIRERDAAAATASRTSPDASSAEDPVRLVEMVFRGMRIAAPPQKRQDDTSARGRIS